MRYIKFRAWTGMGMEYRVVVGQLGAFYVEGLDSEDSACMSRNNTIYSPQTPIMQFTGLLDKNGKEIWEGDIVRHTWSFEVMEDRYETEDEIFEIKYEDSAFVLSKKDSHWDGAPICSAEELEVLGNVYENSNLLETAHANLS